MRNCLLRGKINAIYQLRSKEDTDELVFWTVLDNAELHWLKEEFKTWLVQNTWIIFQEDILIVPISAS